MSASALRVMIGFLLAPGVPALIIYVVTLLSNTRGEATWSAQIFAAVAYLLAFVVGVPVYFYLQRRGINSFTAYAALGAAIGLLCIVLGFVPYALLGDWTTNHDEAFTLLKTAAALAVPAIISGGVGSAVFWLIAIRSGRLSA